MDLELTALGGRGDGFVPLARTKTGRLFRKELLTFGTYAHPNVKGAKLVIDEKLAESVVKNFNDGVCDIVQVPLANEKNEHVENPDANLGEVIGMEIGVNSKGQKAVFATIDARKHAEDLGKTILGTSAFLHLNYVNTKTGERVGPTVLHACATNRPYITGMDNYEEIAASNPTDGEMVFLSLEDEEPAVEETPAETPEPEATSTDSESDTSSKEPAQGLTPQEDPHMELTFDEIKATLKDNFGVDLDEVQELALSAVEAQNALALSQQSESEKDATIATLTGQVTDQETRLSATESELTKMRTKAATDEVEALVKAGKVLPKQKDVMIALALSNREQFEALVPDDSIVQLTEKGVETHDAPDTTKQAEIDRIAAMANG
jgi:hypothetical protein